jgi:predicted transcriptional regulator
MATLKEKMTLLIKSQPDDACYEEIMPELAFQHMIDSGLEDSRQGKVIDNEGMQRRIHSWQNTTI